MYPGELDCKTVMVYANALGLQTKGLEPMSNLRVRLGRDAVVFRGDRTLLDMIASKNDCVGGYSPPFP